MTRIAVGLEYDGTAYAGWQAQAASIRSIQAAAEAAFTEVADHPVRLVCAGRTDTGVHAVEQVAHFDTIATRTDRSWVFGANTNLPNDICVLWARVVREDFHARYSALARTYRYVILQRSSRPALQRKRVCWSHKLLDEDRMAAAAAYLVGVHDFSAFRAAECQSRTPIRDLQSIQVRRAGHYLLVDVRANAFLHHMVRNIAGVLMRIGAGEAEPNWAQEVLQGRDRTLGAITAPAGGLYLMKVTYPADYQLPVAETAVPADLSFIIPRP